MEDTEILQAALRKALDNGWLPDQYQAADIPYIDKTWRNVMLNPDFAKKLWGWKFKEGENNWSYRLKEWVVSDDPISYLMEHIDGKTN